MSLDKEILWSIGEYIHKEYPGVFLTKYEILYIGKKAGLGSPERFLKRWIRPFATEHGNNLWKVKTREEREAELGRLM